MPTTPPPKLFAPPASLTHSDRGDPSAPDRVLLAEAWPDSLRSRVEAALAAAGVQTHCTRSVAELGEAIERFVPHLVLVPFGADALELCGALRAHGRFGQLGLALVSDQELPPAQVTAGLLAGADDVLLVTLEREAEWLARVRVQLRNQRQRECLTRLAGAATRAPALVRDPVSGALARRCFEEQVELTRAAREETGAGYALLCLALDGLSQLRASSRSAADAALRLCVRTLQAGMRQGDLLGRWDDELLVMLLPGAPPSVALRVAERHRAAVVRTGEEQTEASTPTVTLSVAAACWLPGREPDDLQVLVRRAHRALGDARRAGGNCVVDATPSTRHSSLARSANGSYPAAPPALEESCA